MDLMTPGTTARTAIHTASPHTAPSIVNSASEGKIVEKSGFKDIGVTLDPFEAPYDLYKLEMSNGLDFFNKLQP
jgi:hypothetical protein